MAAPSPPSQFWDELYRSGGDAWELGQAAPPLRLFLQDHPLAPQPPGRVLVPGCGRGHEARLLADLGFDVVGLDFSAAALAEARRLSGASGKAVHWLQANLLAPDESGSDALEAARFDGILEHTCFCAIPPEQRPTYLKRVHSLLKPSGWLLGLFWCHGRPGGPPWGIAAADLALALEQAGFQPRIWEPALGSIPEREQEWLGLWTRQEDPAAGQSSGFTAAMLASQDRPADAPTRALEASLDDLGRIRAALLYMGRDLQHRSFAVSAERRQLLWEEQDRCLALAETIDRLIQARADNPGKSG